MTTDAEAPSPRRIACARCGTAFECRLNGHCWCAQEEFRLPLPETGEDCLCPACLREAGALAQRKIAVP